MLSKPNESVSEYGGGLLWFVSRYCLKGSCCHRLVLSEVTEIRVCDDGIMGRIKDGMLGLTYGMMLGLKVFHPGYECYLP